jgi:methylglutaconyl-CoA hydratase
MTGFQRVRLAVEEGVATIALARPEKRNALDDLAVAELKDAFGRAAAAPAARVVLLRGEGPDFCTGADLSQLERIASAAGPLENLDDATSLGELFILMRRLEKPIIAAVHGHAFAGGAGLATACDLVVASEKAVFGYPEVQLGFVPAMVMALLRRTTTEKIAFELVARGDRIDALEAQRIGLVNRVFADVTLRQDAAEYARELAARPASALRLIKRLLYGIDGAAFEASIARGAEVNVLARTTEETRAGVQRFLDQRKRSG